MGKIEPKNCISGEKWWLWGMQLIVLYLRIHQYRSCQPPYENLLWAHILAKKHKSALVSVCNSCHGKNSLDRINNLMMGMTIQVSTNKEENYDDNGDDDDENDSDDGRSMEFETPLCPINNRPSSASDDIIIIIIIIIIITRPRPAFGRLGLGRSSGGKTSGGVSTPRFAPSALSSALKQYILAILSQSSSSLLYAKV